MNSEVVRFFIYFFSLANTDRQFTHVYNFNTPTFFNNKVILYPDYFVIVEQHRSTKCHSVVLSVIVAPWLW